MPIDLIEASRTFAKVTVGTLSGQRGLGIRLYIKLDLLVWDREANTAGGCLQDLSADVYIRGRAGQEVLAGRAYEADATAPTRQCDQRTEAQVRLALDLSRHQLDSWEHLRQGGPFTLVVAYRGLATDAAGHLDHLI